MEVMYLNHPSGSTIDYTEPHVMAMGFFDGVHLGHQSLLKHAKRIAKQQNRPFTAMTFSPHPNEIIKGEKNRKYLTPWSVKVERMASMGCEKLFVVNFDMSFATLSPKRFINQYILNLNAKHIVAGFDFTFGHKAKGDTDYLQMESLEHPFDVSIISKKTHNHAKISSTLIRDLITDGDVHLVPYYLGSHYEVEGKIDNVKTTTEVAEKTMEIDIDDKYILPKPGLYQVQFYDGQRNFQGYFQRFNDKKNEIVLTGWERPIGNTFSFKFMDRVLSASMVSV